MVDKNTDFFKIGNNFAKTAQKPSISIIESKLDFVPKVTIAIPTFKRGHLVKEAIESAINQVGFEEYEILIVDNESDFDKETETEKVIRSFNCNRIRYYRNKENIEMFGNWNRCVELSNAEWICFLHDDDILSPNYLLRIYSELKLNDSIKMLSVKLDRFNDVGKLNYSNKIAKSMLGLYRSLYRCFQKPLLRAKLSDFMFGFHIPLVGSCINRNCILELGGFNQDFFPSADYYFTVGFFIKYNNVYFLREPLYKYRIGSNESLQLNTQELFIQNDYYYLNALINKYFRSCNLLLINLNKCFLNYRIRNEILPLNKDYIEVIPLFVELKKCGPCNILCNSMFKMLIKIRMHKYA